MEAGSPQPGAPVFRQNRGSLQAARPRGRKSAAPLFHRGAPSQNRVSAPPLIPVKGPAAPPIPAALTEFPPPRPPAAVVRPPRRAAARLHPSPPPAVPGGTCRPPLLAPLPGPARALLAAPPTRSHRNFRLRGGSDANGAGSDRAAMMETGTGSRSEQRPGPQGLSVTRPGPALPAAPCTPFG